jgi:hypothetical protein
MTEKLTQVSYQGQDYLLEIKYNSQTGILDIGNPEIDTFDEDFFKKIYSPNLWSQNYENETFVDNNFIKLSRSFFSQTQIFLNQPFTTATFLREKVFLLLDKNTSQVDLFEEVYLKSYQNLLKFPSINTLVKIIKPFINFNVDSLETSYNYGFVGIYNDLYIPIDINVQEPLNNLFIIFNYLKPAGQTIEIGSVSKKVLSFESETFEILSLDSSIFKSQGLNIKKSITQKDINEYINKQKG